MATELMRWTAGGLIFADARVRPRILVATAGRLSRRIPRRNVRHSMTEYSERELVLRTPALLDQNPAGLTTSDLIRELTMIYRDLNNAIRRPRRRSASRPRSAAISRRPSHTYSRPESVHES